MTASRTALVVGASSDIGSAVAHALAADGFECVLWGRDRSRLPQRGAAYDEVDLRSAADVWDELLSVNLAAAMR